ncbi:hypothetical protein TSUD_218380 [Trifolium subterraneum]|uniref:Uncharacterized protein n=1 Tax=Trifolium subterraneum TaxID=3900 RepID=A0A2Z6MMG5_TRISU|nr:hypothetical protein TSUD_218380 [Trifolium subterraneum]
MTLPAVLVFSEFNFDPLIRVSNELGAIHPSATRLAVHVVLILALIEGTLVGTVMILIHNIWAYALGFHQPLRLAFVLCIGGKGLWLGMICALVVQAKKTIDRVNDSMTPESIVS